MNKGLIIGIIVILAIVGIGIWSFLTYGMDGQTGLTGINQNTNQKGNVAKGTLYFSFKDAAVNMANVSAVTMTVDKAYVHSQSQGWVTLSSNPQTFRLLELKESGKAALMVKADVKPDTYDQMWFHISNVMVTETGKTAKQAMVPGSDFKMQGVVKVAADGASIVTLDILADQSLSKTAKGEFIFAPVVNFEGRSNAVVNMGIDNMITIVSGTVDSSTSAGMDINGEVKANFKVDLKANLQIDNGLIIIKTGL